MHFSTFILVIKLLDAQNLFYSKFISCLYMFRAPCAHRQELKIVCIQPLVSSHLQVAVPCQLDAQNLFYNKFISCLYMFRAPCAHRQEVKIVLYSLWYHHTYRWPSRANLMHKICFTISLFHASACFEHHVLIVRRSKLYYTASCIITLIGVMIPEAV